MTMTQAGLHALVHSADAEQRRNRAAGEAIYALWCAEAEVAAATTRNLPDHCPDLGPLAIVWKNGGPQPHPTVCAACGEPVQAGPSGWLHEYAEQDAHHAARS